MPQQTVSSATPVVAGAMGRAGVVSIHAMGLRSDLEPAPADQEVLILKHLGLIDGMVRRRVVVARAA